MTGKHLTDRHKVDETNVHNKYYYKDRNQDRQGDGHKSTNTKTVTLQRL